MPQHQQSLQLTDNYRRLLFATREQIQTQAKVRWPTIDKLDGTDWVARMAGVVATGQKTALRLTGAYLTAFAGSEIGKPQRPISLNSTAYSGSGSTGKPLAESLRSPLIGTLAALKKGKSSDEALKIGLDRAVRQVGMDFDAAHRKALSETIHADQRFDGWHRALRGTCGACAASAAGLSHALWFPAHPGCQCVQEPNVRGTRDRFPRPTGLIIFAQKSPDEQNQMLGPEAADLVRSGAASLSDFVSHSEMDSEHNFITQKPVSDLQ